MKSSPDFKRCPRCGQTKQHNEFYSDPARIDGLASYCKVCQKQYSRECRQSHKEEYSSYRKKYLASPAGKARNAIHNCKRGAMAKELPGDLGADQWDLILWLQGYVCPSCQREFSDELPPSRDHIVPLSRGGSLTFSNVQALCKSCNSKKSAKHIDFRWWRTWNWPSLIMFI